MDKLSLQLTALLTRVEQRDPAVLLPLVATAVLLSLSILFWSCGSSSSPESEDGDSHEAVGQKRSDGQSSSSPRGNGDKPVPAPQTPSKTSAASDGKNKTPSPANASDIKSGTLMTGSLTKPGKFLGDSTKKKKTFELLRPQDQPTSLVLNYGLGESAEGSPTRAIKHIYLGRESGAEAHPGTNYFTVHQLLTSDVGLKIRLEAENEKSRDEWVQKINLAVKETASIQ